MIMLRVCLTILDAQKQKKFCLAILKYKKNSERFEITAQVPTDFIAHHFA